MFEDLDQFVLATNNGSLYYISDNKSFITFASEGYFLEKLKKKTASDRSTKVLELNS